MTFASIIRDISTFTSVLVAYSHPTMRARKLDEAGDCAWYAVELWNKGDYQQAQQCFEESLAILEHLAPKSGGLVWHYHYLGRMCYKQGNIVDAIRWQRLAIETHDGGDPKCRLLAKSYALLGLALYEQQAYDESVFCLEMAVDVFLEIGESRWVADSCYVLGLALLDGEMDYGAAITHVKRAVEIYECERPGSQSIQKCYFVLGRLYKREGRSAEAIASFDKATESAKNRSPGFVHLAKLLRGLAVLHHYQNTSREAAYTTQVAVAALERHASKTSPLPVDHKFLGKFATNRDHSEETTRYLRKVVESQRKLGDKRIREPLSAIIAN